MTAFWCGYDNQGNLFVDGEGETGASLVELAKNAQSFETLSIAPHIEGVFLRIQWDGSYLTVEAQSNYKRGTHHAVSVNRLSISGSAATVVGTTQIKTIRKTAALSWIDGDRVLVPYGNAGRYNPNIGYWKYTAGGAPVTRVEKPAGKTAIINAITISKGSSKLNARASRGQPNPRIGSLLKNVLVHPGHLQCPRHLERRDLWHGRRRGPGCSQRRDKCRDLQQMIWYAQNANASGCQSGPALAVTILFPGNSDVPPPVGAGATDYGAVYEIAVPHGTGATAAVSVSCNSRLRFLGTGNVKLSMVENADGDLGDIFSIDAGGPGRDTGGITFEDLYFEYPTIDEGEGIPEYAAIHVPAAGTVENLRTVRCVFWDCPIGVWIENGLQCSILQSTIWSVLTPDLGFGLAMGPPVASPPNKSMSQAATFSTTSNTERRPGARAYSSWEMTRSA